MVIGWLSGATTKPGGEVNDNYFVRLYDGEAHSDHTADTFEPPETPAHLFPLRAFKQAIFGTPGLVDATPHRSARDSASNAKVTKSVVRVNPKSLTARRDSQAQHKSHSSAAQQGGILLTPGTGAMRRKSVTFGEGVDMKVNNDSKMAEEGDAPVVKTNGKCQHNSCQSNARGQQLKIYKAQEGKDIDQSDATCDMQEPVSASGLYWKKEYEAHVKKSKAELVRALKKEQIAKRYAKIKEVEAQQLATRLEQETSKVAKLEARLSTYIEQLSTASTDLTLLGKRATLLDEGNNAKQPQQVLWKVEVPKKPVRHERHEHILGPDCKTIEAQRGRETHADAFSPIPSGQSSQHLEQRLCSSDIWTNACANDISDKFAQAKVDITSAGMRNHSRSPLAQEDCSLNNNGALKKPKEPSLSREKREAAKRRLEQRRIARFSCADPAKALG